MVSISDKVVLETVKNERRYALECSNNAPLGELYDAICEFLHEVSQRIQASIPPKAPECAPEGTCPTQES